MGKLDEIRALGAPQIGRMAELAIERITITRDELLERCPNIVTQPDNIVTRKRGRPAKHGSGAAKQRAYRNRKKASVG